jgi:hypothetical protein
MSKVSPVLSDDRRSSKTLAEKQTINENMLQARARWAAQTKDKDDIAERDLEEPSSVKKEFAQSLDTASRFRINAEDSADAIENTNHRSKRALSTSTPKSQRILPAPPKGRPPVLDHPLLPGGGSDRPVSPRENPVRPQQVQRGILGEKQMKQVTNTGLKTAAMKKLKKLVKGKTKSSSTVTTPTVRKIGIKKALSENMLVQRSVPYVLQDCAEDQSLPSNILAREYQNVFDDVIPSGGSRSSTNSPTDGGQRPPKPLPRRGYMRHSTGSNESDMGTPPPRSLSPLVTSPTNTATPTSAKSDSSMYSSSHLVTSDLRSSNFRLADMREEFEASGVILEDGVSTDEDEDLGPFLSHNTVTKKPLGKTTSLNPTGEQKWGAAITRNNTSQHKKLRRAVCSDGDQDDLNDDYIKMNSVYHSEFSPSRSLERLLEPEFTTTAPETPDTQDFRAIETKGGQCPIPASPVGNLYVPDDEKRSSAYYLKIIPGQFCSVLPQCSVTGPSIDEEDIYGEVCGQPSVARENVAVSVNEVSADDFTAPEPSSSKQTTVKSTTPPRIISSQDTRKFTTPEPPTQRKRSQGTFTTPEPPIQQRKRSQGTFTTPEPPIQQRKRSQGTFTTPEPPTQQRKRSQGAAETAGTQQLKSQTLVIDRESIQSTIPETPGSSTAEGKRKTSTSGLTQEPRKSCSPEAPLAPVKKEHPLLNLSSMTQRQGERSYYINRKSLIAVESCKDLPTTMLSTVDAATGKVIWHEYVEIDEDKIDKMANYLGLAKSAPIPEKLGVLLGVPKMNIKAPATAASMTTSSDTNATASADTPKMEERGLLAVEESEDSDGEAADNYSLNSSMSSECNYIFNLNDPPNVPPRPDNLDALVSQLKDRTSDDYSYAFFPGNQFFGKHWMITKARSASRPSLFPVNPNVGASRAVQGVKHTEAVRQKKIPTPLSLAKAAKKDPEVTPPSLPPRTTSLLREQELTGASGPTPQPYLMPIIVRTKTVKKKNSKDNTSLPSFVSYIQDRDSTGERSRGSPPKPLPYLEHKKKKQLQKLHSVSSSTHTITAPHTAVGMSYRDTVRRKKGVGRPLGNRGRSRPKAYKKLARQKSRRGSNGKITGVSQRRQGGVGRKNSGGVHKRKKPRGPRPELIDQLKRESLALFIETEGELAEKIRASVRKVETRSLKPTGGEGDGSSITKQERVSTQDLSEVLVRLGNLIKNNQYSEKDLLALITSHFKLKPKDEDALSNESETDDTIESPSAKEGKSSTAILSLAELNAEEEETELANSEESGTEDTGSRTSVVEQPQENKPSYVNLLFDEDDKAGKLEAPKDYKPSYINMEFLTEETATEETTDDELDYVEPSKAIGDCRLKLAMESTMSAKKSSISSLDISPTSTEIITPPEPGNITFPQVPRKRTMSSEVSSQRANLSQLQKPQRERTVSSPLDPIGDLTSDNIDELAEESDLDFRSSPLNWRGRTTPTTAENTSSYNLALEMEDIRFSRSLDDAMIHKTKLSRVTEEEKDEERGERKRKLMECEWGLGVVKTVCHYLTCNGTDQVTCQRNSVTVRQHKICSFLRKLLLLCSEVRYIHVSRPATRLFEPAT